MTRTQGIRKFLKDQGVASISSTEPDERIQVDGEIQVTENVAVQVGYRYFCVVVEHSGSEFEFYDNAPNRARLLADVRKACAA